MAEHQSLLSMLTGSSPVVQMVLFILIGLSIWSWAISISKWMEFRKAKRQSKEFSDIFWETKDLSRADDSSRRLESSPLARVFSSGYREVMRMVQQGMKSDADFVVVESALKRAEVQELFRLEKGITFLATVASAAPFIGLFGTVWGIMNAFHGLSEAKATSIQAVAPGISEALVATAIGLAAAIPAAIAYNYFSALIKQLRQMMGTFSTEFINVTKRSLAAK